MTLASADHIAIDQLIETFFSVFDNRQGRAVDLNRLNELFVPQGIVLKTCGDLPVVNSLEAFIAPRRTLLGGGDLQDFSEVEVWSRTEVFGDIAANATVSMKRPACSKELPSRRAGMKSIQLVRSEEGWKIVSVLWDDEREGGAMIEENAALAGELE